jgi:hypothetical protein
LLLVELPYCRAEESRGSIGPVDVHHFVPPHILNRTCSKDERLFRAVKTSVVGDTVRQTLPHLFLGSRSIAPDLVRKISFSAKLMVSYFFVMVHSSK